MATHPKSQYQLEGRSLTTWVRYRVEQSAAGRKEYVGCQVCMDYVAAGNTLSGRQALGRFMLRIDNPGNNPCDTVVGHIQRACGDHTKAWTWLKERSDGVCAAGGLPCSGPRIAHSLSEQQMNVVFYAYTCIRESMTGPMYAVLLKAAYGIGADIPNSYASDKTYGEITDVVGDVLFEDVFG